MPKVVGIEIGRHEVVTVEMEGSQRRFKVTGVGVIPLSDVAEETAEVAERTAADDGDKTIVPPPSEEASAELTKAIAQLFKRQHLARANVALAFPGRHCVVRAMTLPFKGTEAIRKVIKFESEGQIFSRSVEEMVVDFHVIRETANSTDLLVFAAPKPVLKAQLLSLARAGVEPELVDIEAMALYRCAEVLGLFTGRSATAVATPAATGDAPAGETVEAPPEEAGAAGNYLVIKVSSDASEVVVVRDGALAAVRTMRGGIDAIAEAVARHYSLSIAEARKAVAVVLEGKELEPIAIQMDEAGAAEAAAAAAAEESPAAVPVKSVLVDETVVLEECVRFNARFTREMIRFLSGTKLPGGLRKVFMTGAGGLVPGLQEGLSAALSVPVVEFDPLSLVEHNLPEEEAKAVTHAASVAMGMALRLLGAARGLDLRQEDLVYARKFDRIKFPLALCAMLAVFVVLLADVYLFRSVARLEGQYGALAPQSTAKGARTQFHGYVGWLTSRDGLFGHLMTDENEPELEKIRKELAALDTFQRIPALKRKMQAFFDKQQAKIGYHPDLKLESGLAILVRLAEVLERTQPKLGRFLVTDVDLKVTPAAATKRLSFRIFYRGTEYTHQDAALRRALIEECKEPDSPFEQLVAGNEAETAAEGGRLYSYTLDLNKKIGVFQPLEK